MDADPRPLRPDEEREMRARRRDGMDRVWATLDVERARLARVVEGLADARTRAADLPHAVDCAQAKDTRARCDCGPAVLVGKIAALEAEGRGEGARTTDAATPARVQCYRCGVSGEVYGLTARTALGVGMAYVNGRGWCCEECIGRSADGGTKRKP